MATTRRSRSRARMYAVSMLLVTASCAPSLRSHVSSVGSLAQVRELPALREGKVDLETRGDVRKLLAEPLDADQAVRIALLNNRELRAQLRELGIVAGQVTQAGLIANPTFEIELLPERDSDIELRVEYDITSLIMAPLRRQAEQHDMEAARFEAAGSVIQLGYDVRTRFYALQASTQRLALARGSLDALAASRDTAAALLDAGNVAPLDASSQIAAFERARISVAQRELEVAERREEVQRILGLHGPETAWEVKPVLAEAPSEVAVSEQIEQVALEANLGLRASKKRLDALAKRTGIARTEAWLPEVAVDVHSLRTKNEDARRSDEWRWGGGVSVQVPLFDRGQGRVRSAEARFDALLERYQGSAIALRSTAREVRSRVMSAHARARQYQDVILPAQQKVMEQTLLQYNAMQIGVFQLLQARREQLDVQLAYVDTLREYWTALAEIQALTQGRVVRSAPSAEPAALSAATGEQGGH